MWSLGSQFASALNFVGAEIGEENCQVSPAIGQSEIWSSPAWSLTNRDRHRLRGALDPTLKLACGSRKDGRKPFPDTKGGRP